MQQHLQKQGRHRVRNQCFDWDQDLMLQLTKLLGVSCEVLQIRHNPGFRLMLQR